MSGYIGNGPGRGQRQVFFFVATAGQTSFSGKDSIGLTLTYKPRFIDVYVNGLCIPPSEYTATNGSTIVFGFGLNADDVVYIVAMSAFDLANALALDQNGADIDDKAAFRVNLAVDAARAISGLTGQRNASTATRLDFTASRVVFKSAVGALATASAISLQAVDITIEGPTEAGRDQSAAFSNGSTINFFFIRKDDGTISAIASLASSTTGPTLPSGYTSWAYATTVIMTGANLHNVFIRGAGVWYKSPVTMVVASAAMITSPTSVVVSTYLPINALTAKLNVQLNNSTAGTNIYSMSLGTGGVAMVVFYIGVSASGVTAAAGGPCEIPIVGQTVTYYGNSTLIRGGFDLVGYTVPNGDS